MKLPSHHWADLTAHDFAQMRKNGRIHHVVAVLPVSAVEQHGPHLPLSVDAALADAIVKATVAQLASRTPALFLPPQQVGLSTEHTAFAGTLSLAPATLIALWMEMGACVARAGVRRLVLFNTHGGNVAAMDIVARELRAQQGLMVWQSSWFNLPQPPELQHMFSAHERRFGVHGGDIETSMMLAIHPGLVHMQRAENFHSQSEERAARCRILGDGKTAKLGWQMQDYNAQGAAGNAAAATAQKGQALLDNAARQLALLLQEIADVPWSGK